jgi:hypothetical protein
MARGLLQTEIMRLLLPSVTLFCLSFCIDLGYNFYFWNNRQVIIHFRPSIVRQFRRWGRRTIMNLMNFMSHSYRAWRFCEVDAVEFIRFQADFVGLEVRLGSIGEFSSLRFLLTASIIAHLNLEICYKLFQSSVCHHSVTIHHQHTDLVF